MIIPSVHHFMSRLRELHNRSKNRRSIKISETCLEDLNLMLLFLKQANNGISLNQIVYRKPTHVYRSDSCPAGLGGYSHQGWAWRFYIPPHLQLRASNNLLEHIASIITPWIDMINGRINEGDCALSMTDSTTSEILEQENEFQGGYRRPNRSNSQNRSSERTCKKSDAIWHQRLQPVVQRKR